MINLNSKVIKTALTGALALTAVMTKYSAAQAESYAGTYENNYQNPDSQPALPTQIFGQFTLWVNQSIQVGQMALVMQADGNLVLYHLGMGRAVWYSGTGANCHHGNCYATFQSDGNLVIYQEGRPIWNTATWASGIDALMISEQFPFFAIRSSYAGFWGVVPNGTLIHPYTNTVMVGTMSFR